jgi:hypothetical protein
MQMSDGKRRDAWDRTAAMMALAYNLKRSKRAAAKKMEEYHLFNIAQEEREDEDQAEEVDLSVAKTIFVDSKVPD